MKKDFIFAPIMLAIGVLLFLFKATGMTVHMAISFLGVAILVAYAVATKKEWKLPALEVLMRVFYAIALITGIVLKAAGTIAVVAIIHKACAALFVLALVVLFVHKLVKGKKK